MSAGGLFQTVAEECRAKSVISIGLDSIGREADVMMVVQGCGLSSGRACKNLPFAACVDQVAM